jgi:uncharacterized protein
MLELRPNCKRCNKEPPPESLDARIYAFECISAATALRRHFTDACDCQHVEVAR